MFFLNHTSKMKPILHLKTILSSKTTEQRNAIISNEMTNIKGVSQTS